MEPWFMNFSILIYFNQWFYPLLNSDSDETKANGLTNMDILA